MRKKAGNYIVGNGTDFKIDRPSNGYGYDHELNGEMYYVVHGQTGKILGRYNDEHLAIQLAKGLHATDKKKLSDEMDKVLRGEEET